MPFCTLFNEIFKTFSLKSLQIQKLCLFLHPQLRTNGCKVGAIAQLVEQRTENPCVPGSIPGGTTFFMLNMVKILAKTWKCFLQCFT